MKVGWSYGACREVNAEVELCMKELKDIDFIKYEPLI